MIIGSIPVSERDIQYHEGNIVEIRYHGDYKKIFCEQKLYAITANVSTFAIQVYSNAKAPVIQYILTGVVTKVKEYYIDENDQITLHLLLNVTSESPHLDITKLDIQFGKRLKYKSLLAIRINTTLSTTELESIFKSKYRIIADENGKSYYFSTIFTVSYYYTLRGYKDPKSGYINSGALVFYSENEIASVEEIAELNRIIHEMSGSFI